MAIVLAILAFLLLLMVIGWRARQNRQRDLTAPKPRPADLGTVIGTFQGLYVATTAAGDQLDRIAVHGLGFRSRAVVIVAEPGVLIDLPGTEDTWIPAGDVRELRTATWTIDRVVESGGLELLEWTLGDRTVDSYFRMEQPKAFQNAVAQLLATRTEREES